MDPLAAKGPEWSPYTYSFNSPTRFIDPDGRWAGDFISERGKYLGNDGINDGKLYVVKTTQKTFDSEVISAGISKSQANATEDFIAQTSGNTESFKTNSIAYDNSVEIEGNSDVRQQMVQIVNQDDGGRGMEAANNREYGGIVRNGGVFESPPGPVASPDGKGAGITHPDIRGASTVFHSHPSGTSGLGLYRQAPSEGDRLGASGTRYVFGRRDGKVYIYDHSGVKATISQKYFVTPRK